MKQANFSLLFILILLISSCMGQSSKKLEGTWTLIKQEEEGGLGDINLDLSELIPMNDTVTIQDTIPDIILKFDKSNNLEFIQMGLYQKSSFRLQGNMLTLGDTEYQIEEMTEDKLTLVKEGNGETRYYYRRSEKDIGDYKKE